MDSDHCSPSSKVSLQGLPWPLPSKEEEQLPTPQRGPGLFPWELAGPGREHISWVGVGTLQPTLLPAVSPRLRPAAPDGGALLGPRAAEPGVTGFSPACSQGLSPICMEGRVAAAQQVTRPGIISCLRHFLPGKWLKICLTFPLHGMGP